MTKQSSDNYEIRVMTRPEVDFAVDLAAQEGWNPGIHDADCFYAVDPNGFLIGLLDGEPISCISVIKYPNGYSFLGFYIVKEGYRGQGYGYKIWQAGMDYLSGYTIGLDGVADQVSNYENSGFEFAYNNARYRGVADKTNPVQDERLIELNENSLKAVAAYDQSVFTFPREDFLRLWITRPETFALGVQQDGNLQGYGVIRKCREGYKIGPLFAEDSEPATLLLDALTSRIPKGTPFFIDLPPIDVNPDIESFIADYDVEKVFATARMYRMSDSGANIDIPVEKWFGVTTFELG